MASFSPQVQALTFDSRFSQDYLESSNLLVSPSSRSPIAAVLTPQGQVTALAVVPGMGLQHAVRESSSPTGWNLVAVPGGGAATEVITCTDGANQVHAFYQDGSLTYHSSLGPGGWSPPDTFPPCSSLSAAWDPHGSVVLVGVTQSGDLQVVRQMGRTWQPMKYSVSGKLAGAQLRIGLLQTGNPVGAAVSQGQLEIVEFVGAFPSMMVLPYPVRTPTPVQAILFGFVWQGTATWIFSDIQGDVYAYTGTAITPIPGMKAMQGTGFIDADHLAHIYGADADGTLTVLHQTGWGPDGVTPVWATPLPLDTNVMAVTASDAPQAATTLFLVDPYLRVEALVQQPQTGTRSRTPVLPPGGGQLYDLTCWRTEIQAIDARGVIAPGVPLTITATAETTLLAGNQAYLVGPGEGQSATLTADRTGVLTFACPATDLGSPTFQVSAPGLASPISFSPGQYIQEFLRGNGSIRTGSASIPPMSQTTLQKATVNGQPLCPNLGADTAQAAAQALQQAASLTGSGSPAPTTLAVTGAQLGPATAPAGWALDLTDPASPQFSTFDSLTALNGYQTRVQSKLALNVLGSLANALGDIWHAIKSGAVKVVHWVVDTTNKVAALVVKVGDQLLDLGQLAIEGVEQVIAIVHSILNTLGASVEKVVAWLRDLFDWGDIWRTKQALEQQVTQMVVQLQQVIANRAQAEVQGFFKGLQETIDASLERAAAQLSGLTLGTMSGSSAPVAGSGDPRPTTPASNLPGSWTQNNWLLTKVIDHLDPSLLQKLPITVPQGLYNELTGSLTTMAGDLNGAWRNLTQFFTDTYKDPASILGIGAAKLLEAVRDLLDMVITGLDTVADVILEIVAAVLGDLMTLLTLPLDWLPVVSPLYKTISAKAGAEESPTILGLASLMLALPVTLIYKALHNDQPPIPAFQLPATTTDVMAVTAPPSGPEAWAKANWKKIATLVISVLQTRLDCTSDVLAALDPTGANPLNMLNSLGSTITGLFTQGLTLPQNFLTWDGPLTETAFTRLAWLSGCTTLFVNLAFAVQSPSQVVTMTCTTLLAGASMALGVTGALLGMVGDQGQSSPTNIWDIASALLGPLAGVTSFLASEEMVDGTEGVTLVIKLLIDPVGDIGSAATAFGG